MTREDFDKLTYILGVSLTIKDWEDLISYLPEKYTSEFICQLNEIKAHNYYCESDEEGLENEK